MSSPFSPDRFVHGATCLPCCGPNGPTPPHPAVCGCDLPLYEWGVLNTSSVFDNLNAAADAAAVQTANALVAGFISATQQNLNSLEATWDPLDPSPNLRFAGLFFLDGIGQDSAFLDFWASLAIVPNYSLNVAFNIAGNNLVGTYARVSVYDCNTRELVATQDVPGGGGASLAGNFSFSTANNVIGGEYYVHFEGYGDTDDNNGSTVEATWVVTSNNRFSVGQPIAQIDPADNIVDNELRTRPGFDNTFNNVAGFDGIDNYIENMSANCIVGIFGTALFGIAVTSFEAQISGDTISAQQEQNITGDFVQQGFAFTANAGALLTVTVTATPGDTPNITALIVDHDRQLAYANNTVTAFTLPASLELLVPNTGEYVFQIYSEFGSVILSPFWANWSVSCNQAIEFHPLRPYLSIEHGIACKQIYPCDPAP